MTIHIRKWATFTKEIHAIGYFLARKRNHRRELRAFGGGDL